MGRRLREAGLAARSRQRTRRRAALAVLLLAFLSGGGALAWRSLRPRTPGAENPAARSPAAESHPSAAVAVLDPRDLPFPRDLPRESKAKLDRAIAVHLGALEAYAARRDGDGNGLALQALRLYEEAGALIPELSRLDLDLVTRLYTAGEARPALVEARRWIERFPDSAEHLELLGSAEYSGGDVTGAAGHLASAAALRPGSVKLQRQLAMVYADLGNKEAGIAAAGAALRLIGFPGAGFGDHPEAAATLRSAVETYWRLYEYSSLLPVAEALLTRFPDDAGGLMAAGVARRELGDYAGAEKFLRRVADDPSHGEEARYELGIAIAKLGRPREGAAVLAQLLERSPHHGRGYFQLGQCLTRLGRNGEAEGFFLTSKELAPSEREFRREVELRSVGKPAEARRARARGFALAGRFREAEAALRPPEPGPRDLIFLVEHLVDTLRGREAEEVLRAAARMGGRDSVEVRGWSALVMAIEGRAGEAAALLEPLARAERSGGEWSRMLGVLYLEDLDDSRSAIPWLERARGDPPLPSELAVLARAHLRAGDAASARKLLEGIGRAELDWEEEARLPLALAILRSSPLERTAAAELIAGASPSSRARRLYHVLESELLASSADPAEREREAVERAEAQRLEGLERRWALARKAIACTPWPAAAEPLTAGAQILREMGDRKGAIRLLRLSTTARPDEAGAARLLAEWLDRPGEVFHRLAAIRLWRKAAPGDAQAGRMEEEVRKQISY